ncbi:MAG TPA: hypothetical protein VEF72_22080 [Mycobacterium sp.]|nr:hypothetical protein [Mycobacterium sp.]
MRNTRLRASVAAAVTQQPESGKDMQFWVDALCPWAWIAFPWVLEAKKVRPVRADWRILWSPR